MHSVNRLYIQCICCTHLLSVTTCFILLINVYLYTACTIFASAYLNWLNLYWPTEHWAASVLLVFWSKMVNVKIFPRSSWFIESCLPFYLYITFEEKWYCQGNTCSQDLGGPRLWNLCLSLYSDCTQFVLRSHKFDWLVGFDAQLLFDQQNDVGDLSTFYVIGNLF